MHELLPSVEFYGDWKTWAAALIRALRSNEPGEGGLYFKLKSYTVATLPAAGVAGTGALVYVSNEAGGAVPAFSDGTNWRRVTDRAVVS